MNEKYTVIRTDTADAGLRKIILSIAENFGSETALKKLDEMEKKLRILEDMPYAGGAPRYTVLRRMGYRVFVLGKSLALYKVDNEKKTVTVYVIVDQREDYLKIMSGL